MYGENGVETCSLHMSLHQDAPSMREETLEFSAPNKMLRHSETKSNDVPGLAVYGVQK